LVFALASLYQIDWLGYFDRRLISFILFLAMFAMCFVRLSNRHVKSFKMAVMMVATYFALQSITLFIFLGAEALHFEAKDMVGGQRYGFVYILAFWVLWYDAVLIKSWFVKYAVLLLLVIGLFLTFSRASIVAFGFSCIIAVAHAFIATRISPAKFFRFVASSSLFVMVGVFAMYELAPIVFEFFEVRLIEYVASGDSAEALNDPETSGGIRLFIWSSISEFVLRNPVTGAGFLGVWVLNLFGEDGGSSHSQYFDVLFRVGPFLFLGYLYFLLGMLKHFKKAAPDFFVALAGILVYGLFHETFKESHGAFIFAMLFAIWMQRANLHELSSINK